MACFGWCCNADLFGGDPTMLRCCGCAVLLIVCARYGLSDAELAEVDQQLEELAGQVTNQVGGEAGGAATARLPVVDMMGKAVAT